MAGGPVSRQTTFRTRFAPSPTGPLHLGHAYSAILAHDRARVAGGQFLLRMEDTDLERCRPEWEAQIVEDLTWLGLTWDGPIRRQSDKLADYMARLEPLRDLLYPCSCTRAEIRDTLIHLAIYAGIPAGVEAFRLARQVFAELDATA
mgnify:CR=1 FL=1